jgi:branched-chain amino acid transport system substrate-binding protein
MLKVGLTGAATVASARRPASDRRGAGRPDQDRLAAGIDRRARLGGTAAEARRRVLRKLQNAKGGILGRPIELLIEDTAGNPANCVRKAQEMVERRDCRLLTGITLSSEALAVVPKLAEWDSIFISSDNGDGRLTAESLVPNFFRANISGPMGTRGVSLYLRSAKLQKFYALGLDYAWGHNSVQVFEQEACRIQEGIPR